MPETSAKNEELTRTGMCVPERLRNLAIIASSSPGVSFCKVVELATPQGKSRSPRTKTKVTRSPKSRWLMTRRATRPALTRACHKQLMAQFFGCRKSGQWRIEVPVLRSGTKHLRICRVPTAGDRNHRSDELGQCLLDPRFGDRGIAEREREQFRIIS